jgi:site-specific DNA recombinase
MRLVGYCRVSSLGQADNSSLADQRKKLEAYCVAYDHELVAVLNEVESGKNTQQRPIFHQALELVKTGADGIICTKLDRLARNTRDVLTLVEDVLQPNKKSLVLLDLAIDTSTPMGKCVLTVMAAVAALERDTIAERLAIGRKAKKEKFGYIGGQIAYGTKLENGQLVPNGNEEFVIEIIRKHHKSGKSFYAIAKFLNESGYKSKTGKDWSHTTVEQVYEKLFPHLYPKKG